MPDEHRLVIFLFVGILINVATIMANLSLMATIIKLYTEILKIGHIKNIGKKDV